jgi:formylglycine-generating enzyme required for sulfatase activity
MKQVLFYLLIVGLFSAKANNIQVSNVILTGKNTSAGANDPTNHIFVQFDLSWENSWRVDPATAPNNWDAAWVFVKYRVGAGPWAHATLSTTNSDHSAGSGTAATISTTSDGIGTFIYRTGNGTGTFNIENAQLRWNYRANTVDDNAEIQVQVFAVEMVYVPGGTFTVGDGASQAGNVGPAGYALTTIDNATKYPAGGCCGNGSSNEFHQIPASISNGYPNGFNHYYAMKYPITQKGYVDFLNTLTRAQQANRHFGNAAGDYMAATTGQTSPLNRNGVKIVNAPSTEPWTYACDLNSSNGVNQADDGLHIACNFLNYSDLLSYLDWAGLRPMSVMEFEKLGRGPTAAVSGEYAWGSATIPGKALTLSNIGTPEEGVATSSALNANMIYNQMNDETGPQGPARVGVFATDASTTRVLSGASYYGAMHLSDNVHTFAINVTSSGRGFTGIHGDGTLNANGFYNAANWPGSNATSNPTSANAGFSVKGSCWMHGADFAQISRHAATEEGTASVNRTNFFGGRGVRSAP